MHVVLYCTLLHCAFLQYTSRCTAMIENGFEHRLLYELTRRSFIFPYIHVCIYIMHIQNYRYDSDSAGLGRGKDCLSCAGAVLFVVNCSLCHLCLWLWLLLWFVDNAVGSCVTLRVYRCGGLMWRLYGRNQVCTCWWFGVERWLPRYLVSTFLRYIHPSIGIVQLI